MNNAISSIVRINLLLLSVFLYHAAAQQSWIWARDDHSRPVQLATDYISLILLESRVPSGDNFLGKDSKVGLLISTKFEGSTADEPQARREFPFVFEETADFLGGNKNSKILMDQHILVNYFPLVMGKARYRGISIGITLLRRQDPSVWTNVLSTLLSASKNIVLPSPLTIGINYLNTFSTEVLQKYLPDPDKQKRIDLGTFSFLVSMQPNDLNRLTYTGLHLRVLQPKGTGGGWVDPSRWDSYCFYTNIQASNWVVLVAPKEAPGSTASDIDGSGCSKSKYTHLLNDYVPILLEAQQAPEPPTQMNARLNEFRLRPPGPDKMAERAADLRSAAAAHCKGFRLAVCQPALQ